MRVLIALLLATIAAPGAHAQNWGSVAGGIADVAGRPIAGASIVVAGTNFGTASESDGRYLLRLPAGRHILRFTTVGFADVTEDVVVAADATTHLDVTLEASLYEMEGITVEGAPGAGGPGVHDLTPEQILSLPSPFKGFQALSVLPGVAVNNEMSNQYSVRGGGFNENLVFINGFEVYMPFRPRQGEQEGLGLLNPELADRVRLYTGGFPARYGGKLSSALETRYDRPDGDPVRGSVSVSLLDAGLSNRGSALDGRLGWNIGLRKARARHFFATQEVQGDYRPDYTDAQGLFAYRIAPGHEIEALGILADHDFDLEPQSRKTYFGIVSADPTVPSNLRSFWIRYDGTEHDGYRTRFAGVRLSGRIGRRLRVEHDVAFFGTAERERFDIGGTAVIFRVNPSSGNPDTGSGHYPTGSATQSEFADNLVDVSTWTGRGRYYFQQGRHALETGWHVRELRFQDRIDEHTTLSGRDTGGDPVRIVVDSLLDTASLSAAQSGFYLQDAMNLGRLEVTAGARADHFTFNHEWTASPRLAVRYEASPRWTLDGSWGIYHQAPTYRELRGRPGPGETILGALNHDIRAQRSIQYVVGGEVFLPGRRLLVRAEAFYKDLDRLISYDIRNVRVSYSGANDAEGHAYGLDVRVRGELVPGLESWINYEYLDAVERFYPAYLTDQTDGNVPRPTDQRHTFSLFVQDYVPGDPTWKVHLRGLFGSGLPYTPPIPGPRVGSFVSQIPGERNSDRYPEYRRIDMGVTKEVDFGGTLRLDLTAELLNVFDMTNTVAYSWVPNNDGIWERVPTRLTPRTFNVRARIVY